jgi:hypothetical protein
MDCELKYAWQEAVLDAFLAPPSELITKINVAERTISARMIESEIDFAERMALDDALRMLRVLISEARLQQAEYNQDEKQSSPHLPNGHDCS